MARLGSFHKINSCEAWEVELHYNLNNGLVESTSGGLKYIAATEKKEKL